MKNLIIKIIVVSFIFLGVIATIFYDATLDAPEGTEIPYAYITNVATGPSDWFFLDGEGPYSGYAMIVCKDLERQEEYSIQIEKGIHWKEVGRISDANLFIFNWPIAKLGEMDSFRVVKIGK